MIFDDLGTKNYKMYLTTSKIEKNFRAEIAKTMPYKGNRTAEKPFYYNKIRKLLVEEYGAILVDGQEADDAIGIEQYKIAKQNGNFEWTYIATIDKDLRILEGYHYHLNSRSLDYVSHEEGLKRFYAQLLTGDSVDNIPGLYRFLVLAGRQPEANKLKARYRKTYDEFAIDKTPQECYDYVIDLYKKYGFGDKEINEIGNLLWIRRNEKEIWSDIKNGS